MSGNGTADPFSALSFHGWTPSQHEDGAWVISNGKESPRLIAVAEPGSHCILVLPPTEGPSADRWDTEPYEWMFYKEGHAPALVPISAAEETCRVCLGPISRRSDGGRAACPVCGAGTAIANLSAEVRSLQGVMVLLPEAEEAVSVAAAITAEFKSAMAS